MKPPWPTGRPPSSLPLFDWAGLILISFVLPAILTWVFGLFFRKIGWIKEGDLTLPQ